MIGVEPLDPVVDEVCLQVAPCGLFLPMLGCAHPHTSWVHPCPTCMSFRAESPQANCDGKSQQS